MSTLSQKTKSQIIEFVSSHPLSSSKEIYDGFGKGASYATIKRVLQSLIDEKLIVPIGNRKSTKYKISTEFELIRPISVESYFEKEIDERIIYSGFSHTFIRETLPSVKLFTEKEKIRLEDLHNTFKVNLSKLSKVEVIKELERLAIDLSWKSSQIEGNTYSLLETERLLKDKETAEGRTKDEAVMLLNHKEALDFVIANTDYLVPLKLSRIEDIHSKLVNDLGVNRNIRQGRVGISGTNYTPLDNEYQIREAMEDVCNIINNRESVYEKALLALVLISYIQPFADGNKRTARIISNAILLHYSYCPVSFRTVDSIAYKKAMLIFYEQNNISAFKSIFIDQVEFAVKTYF